jgi:hypothetical protein
MLGPDRSLHAPDLTSEKEMRLPAVGGWGTKADKKFLLVHSEFYGRMVGW